MRILAVDQDERVRTFYARSLGYRRYQVTAIPSLDSELDATGYDVVILDSEETKYKLLNIRYDHIIIAAEKPRAICNGTWAISKPFTIEEMVDMLEVINEGITIPSATRVQ